MTDTVAKRTEAAQHLHDAAKVGRALMGGTKRMRQEGETYLPKFPAESVEAYNARRDSSFLFNGFKKTVKDMTGRVFAKPVEIEGSFDADIEANIDGQGDDLNSFSSNVFKSALEGCGLTFVMADAPRREGEMTKAQAQAQNLRPFLVHIPVEEVLGWKTKTIGSKTVLSQWRMMETIEEQDSDDEFSTLSVEQVRVLTLAEGRVNVRLYRKAADSDKWVIHDEYDTDADEITVRPFYANRTGHLMAEPPLQDLADKNVEHWQKSSDSSTIEHYANVPILHAAGRDEEEPLVISPAMAVVSRNPEARLEWVEHGGKAIAALENKIDKIEFQMQVLGLQLLVAGTETATGASLDAAKETAPLHVMADNLKDCLEQCLSWLTMYQGSAQDVTVNVNTDFGVSMLTPQELTVMLTAVNTGNMPKRVFVEEMKRRGFIAADTDVDLYLEEAEANDDDLMVAGVDDE